MNRNNNRFFSFSFSLGMLFFAFFIGCCGSSEFAYDDDVTSLKHALDKAHAENKALSKQVSELEKALGKTHVSGPISSEYNDALRLFKAKKYGESMAKFQRIFSNHHKHELAPNCIYWVGECYYGMKDYKQAIISFEQVLSQFPGSVKDDDALLMAGHSYFRLNNRHKAEEAYKKLQRTHPKSPYIIKIPPAFRN